MKLALILIVTVAIGTIFFLRSTPGVGGFFSTSPQRDVATHDLDGRVVRQTTILVDDGQAISFSISVTMFGKVGEIDEPWTTVHADLEGLELHTIDGKHWRIPANHEIVWRDATTGEWKSIEDRFPDWDLPPLDRGQSLLEVLLEKSPDDAPLFHEIFPAAAGGASAEKSEEVR